MNPKPSEYGPGMLGFLVFVGIIALLWILMKVMLRQIRRMQFRQRSAGRGADEPQAVEADIAANAPGKAPDDMVGGASGP